MDEKAENNISIVLIAIILGGFIGFMVFQLMNVTLKAKVDILQKACKIISIHD